MLRLSLVFFLMASWLVPLAVQAAGSKTGSGVRLLVNEGRTGTTMDVRNDLDVPITAVLVFSRTVNVQGVGKGPLRKTVPARSRVRVATLRKRQPGYPLMYQHAFSYAMQFSPNPGKSGAVGGHAYALPWQGGPFRITQGAGGDFSHNTPKGRYAVDVAMPVGTPIIAAREGTVVDVRNEQAGRRPDPSGNFVRIRHRDGTESAYLHLQKGSVVVRPGQKVGTGTLLARSGNTGRSTGPHLHFVVQKSDGQSLVSIPFRFSRPVESLPNFAMGGD
ncbi:peptidase M23 [Stutzerimonas nosocomialis]|uniref:Peptidase M23 n=1 Tax=Stutzerimonas nosocomialis TaxID=1056496 RepID=A0A5R9QA02_9GAMM|nr:peptidase M23 [Stutzerimonas nosocomialis]TLX61642.1 peptidase M23 [Stutzerimonas nosocomialis]